LALDRSALLWVEVSLRMKLVSISKMRDVNLFMTIGETVDISTRKLQSAVNKVALDKKMANKIQRIKIGTY
jgi:hypothetical protein